MIRVALDAMGGDHAPGPIVAGAVQAVAADPAVTVVLVGDRAKVEPLLPADGARDRIELFHAADVEAKLCGLVRGWSGTRARRPGRRRGRW